MKSHCVVWADMHNKHASPSAAAHACCCPESQCCLQVLPHVAFTCHLHTQFVCHMMDVCHVHVIVLQCAAWSPLQYFTGAGLWMESLTTAGACQ
jgi:hypothetical protein